MERPPDLEDVEIALLDAIDALEPGDAVCPVDPVELWRVFGAQLDSRHVDHAARWLRAQGVGYYTIGSAGHESNAWVAAALRPTDPALLHYRSGGFYLARASQAGRRDGVRDVLAGMLASVDEPIAGGRHKVFGHRDLAIIPQTSTIASHLPRAVGVAWAVGRARELGVALMWPPDAVVVCSFGDASLNHSTAQGALNTASYLAHRHEPLPLLLVCEDNGLGISVPTPDGWVERSLAGRPGLAYARVEGTDAAGVLDTTWGMAEEVRESGRPGVVHLRTVRLGGHAGSDVEAGYRSAASIRGDRALDPILATARLIVQSGLAAPAELAARYLATRHAVRRLADELRDSKELDSADEVMAPLSPRRPSLVAERASTPPAGADRNGRWGPLPEEQDRLTLAETINRTLGDVLAGDPRTLLFGEDVGVKGGVYGVTRGLQKRAGDRRVFDALLDEQSILGLALGAAVSGFVPIPEIQYLAYLHNAEDQLRGEAASLSFFSNGQYRNGMVVRIAGYAYQKGFGGHFHNDNAVAVLRDIPGVVIASPGHPSDAAPMLRTCAAAAAVDGTVCVYLEPIALYHTRDLHAPGDEGWTAPYDPPERWGDTHVPIGAPRIVREGGDVLVVSWANGLYLSQRVAERLSGEGISCRVLDLRWLAPLPVDEIAAHARAVGRVVIVDETRRSGGVGEGIVAGLVAAGYAGALARVAAEDSFVPLGNAATLVLVTESDIEGAIRAIVTEHRPDSGRA